jgi:hypothetical protein
MMLWDDIIVKYPDLVPELPYDLTMMVWGYEANHPFDERCALFLDSNIPFYVCPGTSTWNTFAGRTGNAIGNLRNAAQNGLEYGAIGFLITDWGDRGHWQINAASYLGFACGAAMAWAVDANKDLDLPPLLDLFVFEDKAGIMGQLVYDLGNVYLIPGHSRPNGHALVDWLRTSATAAEVQAQQESIHSLRRAGESIDEIFARVRDIWSLDAEGPSSEEAETARAGLANILVNGFLLADADSLRQAIARVDEILAPLEQAEMQRLDADVIKREYQVAGAFIQHSARRALHLLGEGDSSAGELRTELEQLLIDYQDNWLARNRPGGLQDSLAKFAPALESYQQA